MENGKNELFSTIFGIVSVVVFIGGIVAILILSDSNKPMSVFVFGAMMFILGITVTAYIGFTIKTIRVLLLPFAGACIMIFSGMVMWGDQKQQDLVAELIPASLLLLFIIIGLYIVGATTIGELSLKRRCTERIVAQCVALNRYRHRRSNNEYRSTFITTFEPVFEFYYNGKAYTARQGYYTNFGIPEIGEDVEIFINTQDPEEIYRPSLFYNIMRYTVGVLFIILGAIALYLYFQSMNIL